MYHIKPKVPRRFVSVSLLFLFPFLSKSLPTISDLHLYADKPLQQYTSTPARESTPTQVPSRPSLSTSTMASDTSLTGDDKKDRRAVALRERDLQGLEDHRTIWPIRSVRTHASPVASWIRHLVHTCQSNEKSTQICLHAQEYSST